MKITIHFVSRARLLMTSMLVAAVLVLVSCGDSGTSPEPETDAAPVTVEASSRPNILLVVADDLGMLDIGTFGSEIRTPNIDHLAQRGVSFTNFHASATCSPTRAMLLTGADSHAAGMGSMIEHLAPNQRGKPGYEGHMSQRVVTVASLLKDAGYRTYMAGKWHLGMKDELLPYRRGFDESFVLLQGGASYFNDMMGLTGMVPDAHYRRNGETVTELPDTFYASEYYADFILENIEAERESGQPFFAYLAFSAPHWPLQVRDQHLDLYKGRYDAGYDALHEERVNKAKTLGIVPADAVSAPRAAHVKAWTELSAEQQKIQSRSMEIYSAVVERMDYHLGRVLDYLKETGEMDNTLIVFMSDNGADGSDRAKLPGNKTWLKEAWDTSYENMGKVGSYVFPGAGWARASVGPYRMYKEFYSEGGLRAPAVIVHPSVASTGERSDAFLTVMDIAPTLLEYADVQHPGTEYKGRQVHAMSGKSLKRFLETGSGQPYGEDEAVSWELHGQKAVHKGDWKLLWLSSKPRWLATPDHADQWGLYNLAVDPGELNDLSDQEPEKFNELLALWEEYAEQWEVVLPEWDAK